MASASSPSFLATRRGKLTLALLCAIAFLDFVDASIVNLALPSIRSALRFSVADLVWVPGGYLLTYGGFMLLGGRMADLLGRRRVLVAGILVIGGSSLVGGLAGSSAVLIGARLAQGIGAALTLPSALSILTTTFEEGRDRHTALGAWGAIGGLASAIGVLMGGLLTQGLGWRWVMYVNPIACLIVLGPVLRLISPQRPAARRRGFDAPGAIVLLASFVICELRHRNPLAPMSIFRINGLGFANLTQLIAFAGFLALFFFLTLYMQNVLHYSPVQAGAAYLPLCFAVGMSAGISSQLLARVGTRRVIVTGAVIATGGLYWLSRIPVHGSYLGDLLPGMIVLALGFGPVFVGVTTAANSGVPRKLAGLAAALLNASQQLGGALGLAIITALATSRTDDLLAAHAPVARAMTAGSSRALVAGSVFIGVAALIALRASITRGESARPDDPDVEAALPAIMLPAEKAV